MSDPALLLRAREFGLYGLVAHWSALRTHDFVEQFVEIEEQERKRRSL